MLRLQHKVLQQAHLPNLDRLGQKARRAGGVAPLPLLSLAEAVSTTMGGAVAPRLLRMVRTAVKPSMMGMLRKKSGRKSACVSVHACNHRTQRGRTRACARTVNP